MSTESPIVVVGAGLAGAMTALYLAKKNLDVKLVEYRADFTSRKTADNENLSSGFGALTDTAKRSINLALSYRGIQSLKDAGLFEKLKPITIPMSGRYLHMPNGATAIVPYGQGDQAILSISRNELNAVIMDEIKKYPNVEVLYRQKVRGIDKEGVLTLENQIDKKVSKHPSKLIVGADGAFSEVRSAMLRLSRVNYSQSFFKLGYKELHIPPNSQGEFALENANCLHIWPRKDFMMIALPNPDKSFTCTLFLGWSGNNGLDYLEKQATENEIKLFFSSSFADIYHLFPDLIQQWRENPASALMTARCEPWHYKDKIVILGDAAHNCLPFLGQGMNAAFEDARALHLLYDEYNGDLSKVCEQFTATRLAAGLAIQEMSEENYVEMSYTSGLLWFRVKKQIDLFLNKLFPSYWVPKYTGVTFTQIPYNEVQKKAIKQDKVFWATTYLTLAGVAAVSAKFAFSYYKKMK